ncbi:TetR/AcrR family transcriptional regulator [Curtobacterium sp. AB451]|uniref:TetR/AcrR family transcriptional regulator n=1 Tax=Curtobacterium sp. AB451 TaxID=3422306 RepID=UPI003D350421
MSSSDTAPVGRRERNKQEKLARITAAASDLFDRMGVDEVTTQQIADAADIGTGTLFLYARSKAELLLLVQNAHYEDAIATGLRASTSDLTTLDAVMALIEPVVVCNRRHVGNGRTYLKELIFGDPTEPFHQRGLELIQQVDLACADVLRRNGSSYDDARVLAQTVSAVLFVHLASPERTDAPTDAVLDAIRRNLDLVLPVRGA